jgi:hypothetical protein
VFQKGLGISWVAEKLLASEGRFMGFVNAILIMRLRLLAFKVFVIFKMPMMISVLL